MNVCPTGALVSKTPSVKNPPLPHEDTDYICTLCEEKCEFTKRTINGKTVKMIPCSLKKSCSLGVFALPTVENIPENASEDVKKDILNRLTGSLDLFKGDKSKITSVESVKELF